MHDLDLYEIDRSYHKTQGVWHAEDDFERTGYSAERHVETMRIVAPSETLARAVVEEANRSFSKENDVRIEAVRRVHIHALIARTW